MCKWVGGGVGKKRGDGMKNSPAREAGELCDERKVPRTAHSRTRIFMEYIVCAVCCVEKWCKQGDFSFGKRTVFPTIIRRFFSLLLLLLFIYLFLIAHDKQHSVLYGFTFHSHYVDPCLGFPEGILTAFPGKPKRAPVGVVIMFVHAP